MEEEEYYDKTNPWILNKVIKLSDRILSSDETANLLIIVLIILGGAALLGIGIITTQAIAPVGGVGVGN